MAPKVITIKIVVDDEAECLCGAPLDVSEIAVYLGKCKVCEHDLWLGEEDEIGVIQ